MIKKEIFSFSGRGAYFIAMSSELYIKDTSENIDGLEDQYQAILNGYNEINTYDL